MIEHVERLRERPEHHRRMIAMAVSGLITGLIALVWLSGTSGKFAKIQEEAALANISDAAASLGDIKAEGLNALESLKTLRNQLLEQAATLENTSERR